MLVVHGNMDAKDFHKCMSEQTDPNNQKIMFEDQWPLVDELAPMQIGQTILKLTIAYKMLSSNLDTAINDHRAGTKPENRKCTIEQTAPALAIVTEALLRLRESPKYQEYILQRLSIKEQYKLG